MKLRFALKPAALALVLSFSGMVSAASYTTLTLPSLNADLTSWTDGGAYTALFPSTTALAGVPFQFTGSANGANVFAGTGSTDIAVGVYGVTNVYTLINTAWGSQGAAVGSITFNGSAGDSYTVALVEGDNVRDHYFGGYVNGTTASYVTQAVWGVNGSGHAHLDLQNFALPVAFRNETLVNIVFNSTGGYSGSPFIAAATVAAVPEPETYAMLLAGLGVLGMMARRRQSA